MAVVRAKGKLRGRAPKLSAKQQRELVRMYGTGEYAIAGCGRIPQSGLRTWQSTSSERRTGTDMGELSWRKSSRSGATNGDCVEVARPGVVDAAVRDSKNRPQGHVEVSGPAWQALLGTLRR